MLIIFLIIISLCLVGLVVLALKKVPQLANFSAPVKAQSETSSELTRESLVRAEDKQKKVRFKFNLDRVFHKIKSVRFWQKKPGFSASHALAKAQKSTNVFLSLKKQFSGLKGKFTLAKKDEFDKLQKLFRRTPEDKKIIQDESDLMSPVKSPVKTSLPTDAPFLLPKAKTLDFNGFVANGKKEPSYEIKKTSFDKAFKTDLKFAAKAEKAKDRLASLKKTQAKKDKQFLKLQKLHSQEQALIRKIAQNPKDLKLYQKLSDLYLKINNFKDAQASLEYILRIQPYNKKATKSLAKIKKMLHNK